MGTTCKKNLVAAFDVIGLRYFAPDFHMLLERLRRYVNNQGYMFFEFDS